MFRRSGNSAEEGRAKKAIRDIFTPNFDRYAQSRTKSHVTSTVTNALSGRRRQRQPAIRDFYVVGAGTFLGPPGGGASLGANALATRTANINRLVVAQDLANWVDGAQDRDRIDVRRLWVKTVDPAQPERNFSPSDSLVLAKTSGISPKFTAVDHTAATYQGAFVYNVGVNLQSLQAILISRPAAVLGPAISPELWSDQAGQDAARQFLENYTLVPLRVATASTTDVNVERIGVTYWSVPPNLAQTALYPPPLPQTVLYISVRPASQAPSATQAPVSRTPGPPPVIPGPSQAPGSTAPDSNTTRTGREDAPPAPDGYQGLPPPPPPPTYDTAAQGRPREAGRQIQPENAAAQIRFQQDWNRNNERLQSHMLPIMEANPNATDEELFRLINANPPVVQYTDPEQPPVPAFTSSGAHNWDVPDGTYDESVLHDQGTNSHMLNFDNSVMPFHEVSPGAPEGQGQGQGSLGSQASRSQPAQPSGTMPSSAPETSAPGLPGSAEATDRSSRRYNAQPRGESSLNQDRRFRVQQNNGEGRGQPRQPSGPPPQPPPAQ